MQARCERYPLSRPVFDAVFDFEDVFDDLFANLSGVAATSRSTRRQALDVAEYPNEIVVVAELPGVKKEDLRITLDDCVLVVSGDRKKPGLPEGSSWIRREIPGGPFTRTVHLPYDVQAGDVSAELANGILRVSLPKAEKARAREIEIR